METENLLQSLVQRALSKNFKPTVAAAWPHDRSSLEAIAQAVETNLVDAILVGCESIITNEMPAFAGNPHITFIEISTPEDAARTAVSVVKQGNAQLLMKGLVSTDILLRAILDKENGLLPKGNVLTHITIANIPGYHKLLSFGDVAVMPHPSDEQREAQIRLMVSLCHSLGIDKPRISLIHCSEKPDPRHFPYTAHYQEVATKASKGEYGDCIVDGPLDVKTSCCIEAAKTKGIQSPIEGDADALIFPEIESGNAFYKTITLFAAATTACLVLGADVPVIVPSRGDSHETMFYSLAAACCMIKNP